MSTKAKPLTSRETASDADKLKIIKDFPGLSNELTFVQELVKSLNEHTEQDESDGTMNQSDAEKLETLLDVYYKFENKICRQMIGDELTEANAVSILMKYMNILTKDGSDYSFDYNSNWFHLQFSRILGVSGEMRYNYQRYRAILLVLLNYTDASPNLCKQVASTKMLEMLLHNMKYFQKTFNSNKEQRFIVVTAMSIFHNCVSVSENIKFAREINAFDTVAWYAQNTGQDDKDDLVIASMMALSYIVDDKNDDIILANKYIIERFLKLLDEKKEEGLESSDGQGFTRVEVIRALTRLANNDTNSETVVEQGILKSLLEMMEGDEEDKFVAVEALWGLAFVDVNKEKIKTFENGKLMEYLQKFSKSESIELQQAADGALWVLDLAKKFEEKQLSQTSKQKGGHVMISYQWDSQDTMTKVRDFLKSEGYNVWMDIDKMKGSILEAMANAVEEASVVLVCLSQKYKDSHNCRAEGEYAFCIKKPLIPVLVENMYKADGWLGILVGMKMYYDLSDQQKFQHNISKLVEELSGKK